MSAEVVAQPVKACQLDGHGRTHGSDWNFWPENLRVREYPAVAS